MMAIELVKGWDLFIEEWRKPMNNVAELKTSSVFVDLENMAMAGERLGIRFDLAHLMTRVGQVSVPVLRKAYGDWGRFAKYQDDFVERAFDLIQLFSIASGKNGLDIQMSVDAMEAISLWPRITTTFLITGDSDYCPLVRMLRKHGRQVIGIGWLHCAGKAFQEHCDEFWPYDDMTGPSPSQQKFIDSEVVKRLISQAAAELGPGECVRMSILKDTLRHYDPTFDEKQYGFTKFSEFVAAYPDLQVKSSANSSHDLVQLPRCNYIEQNGKH